MPTAALPLISDSSTASTRNRIVCTISATPSAADVRSSARAPLADTVRLARIFILTSRATA